MQVVFKAVLSNMGLELPLLVDLGNSAVNNIKRNNNMVSDTF